MCCVCLCVWCMCVCVYVCYVCMCVCVCVCVWVCVCVCMCMCVCMVCVSIPKAFKYLKANNRYSFLCTVCGNSLGGTLCSFTTVHWTTMFSHKLCKVILWSIAFSLSINNIGIRTCYYESLTIFFSNCENFPSKRLTCMVHITACL